MKKIIQFSTMLILAMVFAQSISAQVPVDTIASLLRSGDAQSLAGYFSQTLDIGLPDKDQDYSREQGERVLKDFFEKHPPSEYNVEESGPLGEESHFIIGSYLSGNDRFQAYIIIKKYGEKWQISKLKFEKE